MWYYSTYLKKFTGQHNDKYKKSKKCSEIKFTSDELFLALDKRNLAPGVLLWIYILYIAKCWMLCKIRKRNDSQFYFCSATYALSIECDIIIILFFSAQRPGWRSPLDGYLAKFKRQLDDFSVECTDKCYRSLCSISR